MPDHKQEQAWKNYSVLDHSGLPKWVQFGSIPVVAIPIAFGFWIQVPYLGILIGVGALVIWIFTFRPTGCPHCKGSVTTREVEEENGFRRFFHDCPACQISWRCKPHWDSADD